MTSAHDRATTTTDQRSPVSGHGASRLPVAARAAVAVSAAGLLATTIGVLTDAKGFRSNSSTTTTLSQICFVAFVLGAVAALAVCGAAVARRRGPVKPILVVVGGYLVVAAVVVALSSLAN